MHGVSSSGQLGCCGRHPAGKESGVLLQEAAGRDGKMHGGDKDVTDTPRGPSFSGEGKAARGLQHPSFSSLAPRKEKKKKKRMGGKEEKSCKTKQKCKSFCLYFFS